MRSIESLESKQNGWTGKKEKSLFTLDNGPFIEPGFLPPPLQVISGDIERVRHGVFPVMSVDELTDALQFNPEKPDTKSLFARLLPANHDTDRASQRSLARVLKYFRNLNSQTVGEPDIEFLERMAAVCERQVESEQRICEDGAFILKKAEELSPGSVSFRALTFALDLPGETRLENPMFLPQSVVNQALVQRAEDVRLLHTYQQETQPPASCGVLFTVWQQPEQENLSIRITDFAY